MASSIDATKPIAGTPTTQSVRDNFAFAKSEIETLQTGKAELAGSATQLFKSLNFVPGYTSSVTSAGTTTLTASSTYYQDFTGSNPHTAVLPDVTTLSLGHSYFIDNDSTGALTVNSSGGNLVKTFPAGFFGIVTCVAITGTGAASWSTRMPQIVPVTSGGTLEVADAATGGNVATTAQALYQAVTASNLCHITIAIININTTGLTAGNQVFIRGLPFTAASMPNGIQIVGGVDQSNVTVTTQLTGRITQGTNYILMRDGTGLMIVSQITSGAGDLYLTFTYKVA